MVKEEAAPVLGQRTAKRIDAFGNGDLYVEAGVIARTFAWFIDFVVFAVGVVVGIGLIGAVASAAGLSDGVVGLLGVATLFVVPILYGFCYGNGRALGAIVTGTQLVRLKDGGRIGAKACWAMLLRTVLLPLLLVGMVASAFDGIPFAPDGSGVRTSIDRDATRRLRAMEFPER